ncbi:GNAT family N-acetyltransferase [Plastoroseomonas arctica]|nr:GNAT family N-acetyltransferase [Plastoroseomonas arctica]
MAIRSFEERDANAVRELFITVNRLLAPPDMRDAFETYIDQSLVEEMDRVAAYYAEHGGAFWVAERAGAIIGMFGLEPHDDHFLELRRMYVSPTERRTGIASAMLEFAEDECRRRGFSRMELSTSELQPAAVALYRRAEYALTREVVADQASNKTIGGGIRRFHFAKVL